LRESWLGILLNPGQEFPYFANPAPAGEIDVDVRIGSKAEILTASIKYLL
jgi:hypothetical protein